MEGERTLVNGWKDWWFARIHRNTLIYNTCWEDPVSDKAGLAINPGSDILMITSAGCNALSYLLDDPTSIDCVDLNPRQNALLELKMSVIRTEDHATLFQLFGEGVHPDFPGLYRSRLREQLSESAQRFWDGHKYYFSGKGIRKSFYQHGTAGILAFLVGKYMALRPGLKAGLMEVFRSTTLEEQREKYLKVEAQLLNQWFKPLIQNHFTMTMAGVPVDQQRLAAQTDPEGLFGYVKRSLRSVFFHLPASENYFWRLYVEGRYTPDCCPEYLEEASFQTLKQKVDRIRVFTNSIEDHLNATEKDYTHFILLDHQDWLAKRNMAGLIAEWDAVFARAAKGAKVLMRSAADSTDFLPESVRTRLVRDTAAEDKMKALDRVGTYTSTWLMTTP